MKILRYEFEKPTCNIQELFEKSIGLFESIMSGIYITSEDQAMNLCEYIQDLAAKDIIYQQMLTWLYNEYLVTFEKVTGWKLPLHLRFLTDYLNSQDNSSTDPGIYKLYLQDDYSETITIILMIDEDETIPSFS